MKMKISRHSTLAAVALLSMFVTSQAWAGAGANILAGPVHIGLQWGPTANKDTKKTHRKKSAIKGGQKAEDDIDDIVIDPGEPEPGINPTG